MVVIQYQIVGIHPLSVYRISSSLDIERQPMEIAEDLLSM